MLKIYLAASWSRREEMRDVRVKLEGEGHVVTSRWLDEKEGEPKAVAARADLDDIDASDVLLAFTENADVGYQTGGRHVELGYALAKRIPVILVGLRENVFHHLGHIPVADSVKDVLRLLCR